MNSPRKKLSKEQYQRLRELCSEFSLRELVDEKVGQIVDQVNSGNTCGREEIYNCVMGVVEKSLVDMALKKAEGNKTRAAEILGLNRNTLSRKIKTPPKN
jgi:DNA-binding protein Fis